MTCVTGQTDDSQIHCTHTLEVSPCPLQKKCDKRELAAPRKARKGQLRHAWKLQQMTTGTHSKTTSTAVMNCLLHHVALAHNAKTQRGSPIDGMLQPCSSPVLIFHTATIFPNYTSCKTFALAMVSSSTAPSPPSLQPSFICISSDLSFPFFDFGDVG